MLDMQEIVQKDGSLHILSPYIYWDKDSNIVLDGGFDLEELQQIVDHIRAKSEETKGGDKDV